MEERGVSKYLMERNEGKGCVQGLDGGKGCVQGLDGGKGRVQVLDGAQ